MHLLDNPIWNALASRQQHFAEVRDEARKFPSEVTTLAGLAEVARDAFEALAELLRPDETTALFLEAAVELPVTLTVVRTLPLVQMLYNGPATAPSHLKSSPLQFTELTSADVPEMVALAKLTEPGPFGRRTRELGTYIAIRADGNLAAMAGERLKLPGYTEVSAVCTHPDYAGRGYATALVAEMTARICTRGAQPFLHTREDNLRAIQVYERLGFEKRKVFHLAVVRRNG
jgi:predicted GNAT family acetyltransferase